jgi:hypothetical protein
MALSMLYRLFLCMLGLLWLQRMDAAAKDAEILVLRHQLTVLRCTARWRVRGSRGRTGRSSPRWQSSCHENAGQRSRSRPRPSSAGTGRW